MGLKLGVCCRGEAGVCLAASPLRVGDHHNKDVSQGFGIGKWYFELDGINDRTRQLHDWNGNLVDSVITGLNIRPIAAAISVHSVRGSIQESGVQVCRASLSERIPI